MERLVLGIPLFYFATKSFRHAYKYNSIRKLPMIRSTLKIDDHFKPFLLVEKNGIVENNIAINNKPTILSFWDVEHDYMIDGKKVLMPSNKIFNISYREFDHYVLVDALYDDQVNINLFLASELTMGTFYSSLLFATIYTF